MNTVDAARGENACPSPPSADRPMPRGKGGPASRGKGKGGPASTGKGIDFKKLREQEKLKQTQQRVQDNLNLADQHLREALAALLQLDELRDQIHGVLHERLAGWQCPFQVPPGCTPAAPPVPAGGPFQLHGNSPHQVAPPLRQNTRRVERRVHGCSQGVVQSANTQPSLILRVQLDDSTGAPLKTEFAALQIQFDKELAVHVCLVV